MAASPYFAAFAAWRKRGLNLLAQRFFDRVAPISFGENFVPGSLKIAGESCRHSASGKRR
jgi:hypothetical protein